MRRPLYISLSGFMIEPLRLVGHEHKHGVLRGVLRVVHLPVVFRVVVLAGNVERGSVHAILIVGRCHSLTVIQQAHDIGQSDRTTRHLFAGVHVELRRDAGNRRFVVDVLPEIDALIVAKAQIPGAKDGRIDPAPRVVDKGLIQQQLLFALRGMAQEMQRVAAVCTR